MSVPTSTKATAPGPKPRRSYNEEFKREAVKLAESIGATQAAHDLGIDRSLVSSWKKSLATEGTDAFRGKGHPTEEQSEMLRLRRENATLRAEREILKKAAEFFMREQS
jgi:transposase-like protein